MTTKEIFKNSYTQYKAGTLKKQGPPMPKIIHQIWLGSPFPEAYKAWQESFKKFHPDWKYMLWTDAEVATLKLTHPDVYEKTKNYGAKSDILRYEILYQYGGVYADTDFECLGSFETLRQNTDFFTSILEDVDTPVFPNGLIAAIPKHPILKACIENLKKPVNTKNATLLIELSDGPFFTECVLNAFTIGGLANLILPHTFFYPFPAGERHVRDRNYAMKYVKPETLAIHYWEVSWHPKKNVFETFLQKILPKPVKELIKKIIKY